MAKMITRTITSTKVTAVVFSTDTNTPETIELIVTGRYIDDKHLLKAAKAQYDSSILTVLHIISAETVEQLYGMTETDFVTFGHPISR